MTKYIRLSNLKINICFKSKDSRVHSEICIIYSSKNSEFTVKTPSQCIYLFKDTRLDMGLTYLHILTYLDFESDKIACLGLQSNKFGFLNTITLHI